MLTDGKRFFNELPNFKYPEAHMRIFYEHLKYFTDSGILPCHWSAAFDLITSGEIHEISNTDDMSYAEVLQETKCAIAIENLAALVISQESEGNLLKTMFEMEGLLRDVLGRPVEQDGLVKGKERQLRTPTDLAGLLKDLQLHPLCQ